jgi:hypothetical protein
LTHSRPPYFLIAVYLLSSFFTQVYDSKSTSYVSSSGVSAWLPAKGMAFGGIENKAKVCVLKNTQILSIGLCVCFWKVVNVGVGVYQCMFESIHHSESLVYINQPPLKLRSTNTTCPVSLLIFSLAARLSRFGSCRPLSDPERHMKSRECPERCKKTRE